MTASTQNEAVNGESNGLAVRTKDVGGFGRAFGEKEFLFQKGYVNLNHGSFGTYPRIVRDTLRSFQDAAEARPDHFIRYEYPRLLDESREAMSKLLNTPSSTLVFVPNATTGINIVLRNLTFTSTDHILYLAPIYGACEKTIAYITETTPAQSVKIPFTFPVEDDWLVQAFAAKIDEVEAKGGKVKVAVFDTVVSMPGVRLPFERLTALCKERGVLSCIDGAHGVGHVSLDLGALDPDFFVSNCHKWLHVPRGCAIFHVPTRNQPLIRSTLPTSHGFAPAVADIPSPLPKSAFVDGAKSAFVANFEFVGTIDSAPYLCIPAALQWRQSVGGEDAIRAYCTNLAQQGGRYIAQELGTEVLDNETRTLSQCCMTNVRLPLSLEKAQEYAVKSGFEKGDVGMLVRDWFSRTLISDYNTFVQTVFYAGHWWSRLSGQVYLEQKDFEWAAETLKKLCQRAEEGEWAVPAGKK